MANLYDQYQFNVGAGPYYESSEALPDSVPDNCPVKFIAYYLPQFHSIPENDRWWGAGFTEWTNVTKALPRYLGHRQPNLPADLGFYDLKNVETLRRQAELASRSGIYGFCFHHYWFSGQEVLETPLSLLLGNTDIKLRFCLNWANENWSRRWDGSEHDILLEQRYDPGDELRYVEAILPALRDPRYIKIDGRPLIMLYRPGVVPDARAWVARWRTFLIEQGVGDPYIVMAQAFGDNDPRIYGIDAAAGFAPHNGGWDLPDQRGRVPLIDPKFSGKVRIYEDLAKRMLTNYTTDFPMFPGVCPRWDNEARKPGGGVSFSGANPAAYGDWLEFAARQTLGAVSAHERVVFINAWNEWAEGAVLEPDRHYGYAFLAETRRVVDRLSKGVTKAAKNVPPSRSPLDFSAPSTGHRFVNQLKKLQAAAFSAVLKR